MVILLILCYYMFTLSNGGFLMKEKYYFEKVFIGIKNNQDYLNIIDNLAKEDNVSIYKVIKDINYYMAHYKYKQENYYDSKTNSFIINIIRVSMKYITKDIDINTLENIINTYLEDKKYYNMYIESLSTNISLYAVALLYNTSKEEIENHFNEYMLNFACKNEVKYYYMIDKESTFINKDNDNKKKIYIIKLLNKYLDGDIHIDNITNYIYENFKINKEKLFDIINEYHNDIHGDIKYLYSKLEDTNKKEKQVLEEKSLICKYYEYFTITLKVYSLHYDLDIGYKIMAFENNMNICDIKDGTKIYLDKYASNKDIKKYDRYVNKYNKTRINHLSSYMLNNNIYHLVWDKVLNDNLIEEMKREKIYNIFIKRYIDYLLSNNAYFKYREYLFKRQEELTIHLNEGTLVTSKKDDIKEDKLSDIVKRYLNYNGYLEDFYNQDDIAKNKYKTYDSFYGCVFFLCNKNEFIRRRFAKHERIIKEYELSYLNTLLDIIIPFIKYGVSYENITREFNKLDYYMITSYPLEKLKNNLSNLDLSVEERTLLSSFIMKNIKLDLITISLNKFINSYRIIKSINGTNREITKEEKIAIYNYLLERNVPLKEDIIEIFMEEYAKGRVLLPRVGD